MSAPLLTVAIPTYNRPETLQRTLDALKASDASLFQVLVSDDSSTSGVEEVVKKYQMEMPNLVYNRNPENLGFSGNVSKLYQLATTRYVWFLCDDDTVYPTAIQEMVDSLKKHEPVVALYNYTWEDSYGRVLATDAKDRVYSDEASLGNYHVLMRLTFLSIIVVEKKLPIEPILEIPDYKDNVFVQLTLGLYLLSDNFKLCELSPKIIHRNVGYKYGEFFKFYLLDSLKAVHLIPHKFDNRKFIQWMIGNLPSALQLYLSQKIGLFVFKGNPTEQTYQLLRRFYGPYYYAIIITFRGLCTLVPATLMRTVYLGCLVQMHGFKLGFETYRRLVDRAVTDKRDTGFTSYR